MGICLASGRVVGLAGEIEPFVEDADIADEEAAVVEKQMVFALAAGRLAVDGDFFAEPPGGALGPASRFVHQDGFPTVAQIPGEKRCDAGSGRPLNRGFRGAAAACCQQEEEASRDYAGAERPGGAENQRITTGCLLSRGRFRFPGLFRFLVLLVLIVKRVVAVLGLGEALPGKIVLVGVAPELGLLR